DHLHPHQRERERGHDSGRDPDLLQGLGVGPAGRLQPRLAAQRRRLGRPTPPGGCQRLPRRRPRPPRPRPLRPALGRQRHGHLRRRPGGADRGARPARRRPGRALHRRRRGDPLHRPPRHLPRRQGGAGGRDLAADAQDGGQPRGHPDRSLRRHPGRRRRRPLPVLPGPCRAVLRRQPAGRPGLAGHPGHVLAVVDAGRPQGRVRLHQGLLRDGPDRGPQAVRRADPDRPRRRRPDRADRRLGHALVQDRRGLGPQGLRGGAPRPDRHPQGAVQRRPAGVPGLL
ncbi:MAG: Non-heme chloroperoxidase, partial [uncultured Thermomicrobiales bacterium]